MHRLPVTFESLGEGVPELSLAARAHLKVLRLKEGEQVELFDGRGSSRLFAWSADSRSLVAQGEVRHADRPTPLVLFACVTKGSRWDWTIEKATELGVTRIVPVISARTIVRIALDEREAKCERWRRVAEEAARQSDAAWLPEIVAPVTFPQALALVAETQCFVGALTNPPSPAMGEVLQSSRLDPRVRAPAVFVGPEGDFAPEELEALLRCAVPVSFGMTILRAETAAIFGVSVLKGFLDARTRG